LRRRESTLVGSPARRSSSLFRSLSPPSEASDGFSIAWASAWRGDQLWVVVRRDDGRDPGRLRPSVLLHGTVDGKVGTRPRGFGSSRSSGRSGSARSRIRKRGAAAAITPSRRRRQRQGQKGVRQRSCRPLSAHSASSSDRGHSAFPRLGSLGSLARAHSRTRFASSLGLASSSSVSCSSRIGTPSEHGSLPAKDLIVQGLWRFSLFVGGGAVVTGIAQLIVGA
jgi:hypothetical protein